MTLSARLHDLADRCQAIADDADALHESIEGDHAATCYELGLTTVHLRNRARRLRREAEAAAEEVRT